MKKTTVRKWQRWSSLIALAALLLSFPGTSIAPVLAADVVVQGQVTLPDGSPASGIQIELHVGDGTYSYTATSDTSGNYSFSQTLIEASWGVEIHADRTPDGYNTPGPQGFTYHIGDAARTYNFQLIAAPKKISGQVKNTDGAPINGASVVMTPIDQVNTSQMSTHTDSDGNYSKYLRPGKWFITVQQDYSDQTTRWIYEGVPAELPFDTTSADETATQNFTVTTATGNLKAILLNSDGSKLTTSYFTADIAIRRADGIGTIRKVSTADSSLNIFLTPGIYTMAAYHPDLAGKSFDPAATTFVMTENGSVDLGTIQASTDSAYLKGKVVDTQGRGINNVQVQAIRENGTARPTANSDQNGDFTLLVGAGTWTVGLNTGPGKSQYSQASIATATVANGQTISGLKVQLKIIDKNISGNIINAPGYIATDFVGSVYVRTLNNSARVYAPVVDGKFSLDYSSGDITGKQVIIGIQASPEANFAGGAEKKITISGNSATQNLTLKPYDAVLSGSLKLADGTTVTNPGSEIKVVALDADGNFNETTAGADGSYSLSLAAGTWLYDYEISAPDKTDGLLNRPAGQNSVTIKAGQAISRNLTVQKGTNTITGTVVDANGSVVKRALVTIDNRASLENNGNTNPNNIVSVTVETLETGVYTAKVPNGTYLITVGDMPDLGSQLPPDGKAVKVSSATSVTVDLRFKNPNATLTGTVKLNNKAEGGGNITAYSDDGAQATATVGTNGKYTLNLTSGEKWHVVATDISGKKLLSGDPVDVTPKSGANSSNITIKDAGITVPGPVSKSFDATDGSSVSLPDGTNVSVPPLALDTSGTVTLTVTPTIDIDPTTLDRPASLAYEVKATDSSGREKALLDRPATITLPYTDNNVADNGIREKGLATKFWDPQTQTWSTDGTTGLVNTKNNTATLTTTHLSKFSITGMAKTKPQVKTASVKSRTKTTLVLQLSGANFKGKVAVKFGKVNASKIQVKNSKTVVATIPAKSLKNGSYDLTLTNGDGRKTIKKITLGGRVLGASVVKILQR